MTIEIMYAAARDEVTRLKASLDNALKHCEHQRGEIAKLQHDLMIATVATRVAVKQRDERSDLDEFVAEAEQYFKPDHYMDGRQAFEEGDLREHCPISCKVNIAAYNKWQHGYTTAETEASNVKA